MTNVTVFLDFVSFNNFSEILVSFFFFFLQKFYHQTHRVSPTLSLKTKDHQSKGEK